VLCSPIFTVNPQSIEDLAKRNKETINFDRKSFWKLRSETIFTIELLILITSRTHKSPGPVF